MAKGGPKEICTVPGCGRYRVAWGLCGTHASRFKKHGHVGPTPRSQSRAETTAPDGTRQCFKCGERKLFTSELFPVDPRHPSKLKGTCRACLRAAVRNSTLLGLYGIGTEQFDALLSAQNGACALCGTTLDRSSKVSSPHVDHCHQTGVVRGILCHHCNVLLGHARESSALLRAAINYLDAHGNKELQ